MQTLQPLKAIILGYELTHGQLKIVGSVLDPKVKRLVISCMTRYGKTRVVAIALLLYILNSNDKRILIIAPTTDQTNIIRNYMAELIAKNPTLSNLVDRSTHTGPEHLKSEMSKKRITFKNGCELITLTAHGNENESDPAPNLMGFGGDIVVLDEADLILRKVYTQRISRMLGDSPDSKLIDIVNPWNPNNFSHEHWQNPDFKKVHVDWRQALSEGRVTETYLKEQKAILSEYEWTVLYESNWSNESEDTLIRYDWIQRAVNKTINFTGVTRQTWGLDVAEQGSDLTILTHGETDGVQYRIKTQQWIHEHETMATADAVSEIVPKLDNLNVDSIGVGAGVHSRLKQLGFKAVSIRVSESPEVEPERFINLKAQRFWHLRNIFEQDQISIPNEPKLIHQLSQMRYEFTSAGKIKIIDPEGKSPDYSDSLMLTLIDNLHKIHAWRFG